MARSITEMKKVEETKVEEKKPEIIKDVKPEVTNTVNKVNDNRPGNKYALDITCSCGGKYFPFTHVISNNYVDGITYRCNKCSRDVNVKLRPVIN